MTNPADTHGTKTRHFTPVGTVEPALKATKAMVAPAEKIRQVVEAARNWRLCRRR